MAGFGHSITRNEISHEDYVINCAIYVSLWVSPDVGIINNKVESGILLDLGLTNKMNKTGH